MAENGGRCRFLGFLCKHSAMSYNETLTPIIISAPIIIFCRADQFTTQYVIIITAIMDVSCLMD